MCISWHVEFEWDERKAAANLKKHEIDFADAALVLFDDLALTTRDPGDYGEERFASLGLDPLGRLLVVVYTWREQRARIISARSATPAERKRYESKRSPFGSTMTFCDGSATRFTPRAGATTKAK